MSHYSSSTEHYSIIGGDGMVMSQFDAKPRYNRDSPMFRQAVIRESHRLSKSVEEMIPSIEESLKIIHYRNKYTQGSYKAENDEVHDVIKQKFEEYFYDCTSTDISKMLKTFVVRPWPELWDELPSDVLVFNGVDSKYIIVFVTEPLQSEETPVRNRKTRRKNEMVNQGKLDSREAIRHLSRIHSRRK